MLKKIFFWILIIEILVFWSLSFIQKPTQISFQNIFSPATQEERLDYEAKLSLDTSQIKKIYYNKTTVFKDRYLKNLLVLIDPNNYFFVMHPREDVSGVNYRYKYPFWSIIFLIMAIFVTANNKKYFKIWLAFLLEILVLSFFKNLDGIDLILMIPIDILLILGIKDLSKNKYFLPINIILTFLIAIEIWRIFV